MQNSTNRNNYQINYVLNVFFWGEEDDMKLTERATQIEYIRYDFNASNSTVFFFYFQTMGQICILKSFQYILKIKKLKLKSSRYGALNIMHKFNLILHSRFMWSCGLN